LRTVSYRDPALGKLRLPAIFSEQVTESIKNIGIETQRTAFRSPWENGIAERWVGSARREILDLVIVINEKHLRRLLREYFDY
jgi:transposase InsO family protein